MKLTLLILFVISVNRCVESARILAAMPTPLYSHHMYFQPLWRELAIKGHDVVVLTTNPTHEQLTNFKEIDLGSPNATLFQQLNSENILALNEANIGNIARIKRMKDYFFEIIDYELGLPEVQQLIQNEDERFDLVMIEYFTPMFFAFKHRFNCSFIGVVSEDGPPFAHDTMGNPSHPVLYPNTASPTQVDLTFKDRLLAVAKHVQRLLVNKFISMGMNELNKKHFGEGYPDSLETAESIDLLFINNNPVFTQIRPLMPNTISLAGGLHIRAPKPLPEDLQQFLDGCTRGVIYFSMGSTVQSKTLSNATLLTMMKTFSQVPYNVLWKFEGDELPGKPDNVKIIQWAPQQDLLRHKNIKLFITHAGPHSLEEALLSHVPLVTLPVYADQLGNAANIVHKQLGMKLNYRTLTVDEFRASILEVITNPKYKNNIKRLVWQMQDQPMPPLERAVWWTEYVLRHNGAKHLRPPKIPTYQYYNLDILAFLAGCLLFVCVALYFIGKLVYKSVLRLFGRVSKIKQS